MGHFLLHWLGLDNAAGPVYLFYSGSGSFILKGSLVVLVWHHLNCHEDGCWRIARHTDPVDGVRRCRRCRRRKEA